MTTIKTEHETLTRRKEKLRDALSVVIDSFELETGIFVTSINYTKNQQMCGFNINLDLELPKGIR